MQAKKQKVIRVSPENRKKMLDAFQCSQTTLYQALRYITNSEQAKDIRQSALDKFGGVLDKRVVFN